MGQNADKKIDSQMFVLKKGDTNKIPTNQGKDNEGEGELNADYAARMKKFLAVYDEKIGDGYKPFNISTELKACSGSPDKFYGFVATDAKRLQHLASLLSSTKS